MLLSDDFSSLQPHLFCSKTTLTEVSSAFIRIFNTIFFLLPEKLTFFHSSLHSDTFQDILKQISGPCQILLSSHIFVHSGVCLHPVKGEVVHQIRHLKCSNWCVTSTKAASLSMKINPLDPWSREGSIKIFTGVSHDHPSGDLLGGKSFAKEAGDPGDHPG